MIRVFEAKYREPKVIQVPRPITRFLIQHNHIGIAGNIAKIYLRFHKGALSAPISNTLHCYVHSQLGHSGLKGDTERF